MEQCIHMTCRRVSPFVIQTDKSIAKRRVSDKNKYHTKPKWDFINTKNKIGISIVQHNKGQSNDNMLGHLQAVGDTIKFKKIYTHTLEYRISNYHKSEI